MKIKFFFINVLSLNYYDIEYSPKNDYFPLYNLYYFIVIKNMNNRKNGRYLILYQTFMLKFSIHGIIFDIFEYF